MMPIRLQYLYLFYLIGPEGVDELMRNDIIWNYEIDIWKEVVMAEKMIEEYSNENNKL